MAEISIIIPCYNVETYVMRCFNSLLHQTIGIDKLELIFVDDASTDNTWKILTQIQQISPLSVHIIHLSENQRQGGARNVGLSYAHGRYIGYVDSDDWVEPNMYQELYIALEQTKGQVAFCRHVRDNGENGLILSEQKSSSHIAKETGAPNRMLSIETVRDRSDFIASNIIGSNVWDKLFTKDFLLENAFSFPSHLAYEDIYFSSLIYLYATKVCILEKKLYHYFVNAASTVLAKNKPYHRDIFQVNYLKWDTYRSRGFLLDYREALEFDFLMTYYFTGMKILCLRFDKISYADFMELKKGTLERVPGYAQNPYCHTHVTDFYRLLLTLLGNPVTQDELYQVQKAFRAYHRLS